MNFFKLKERKIQLLRKLKTELLKGNPIDYIEAELNDCCRLIFEKEIDEIISEAEQYEEDEFQSLKGELYLMIEAVERGEEI
jgi:hypothetical protein